MEYLQIYYSRNSDGYTVLCCFGKHSINVIILFQILVFADIDHRCVTNVENTRNFADLKYVYVLRRNPKT